MYTWHVAVFEFNIIWHKHMHLTDLSMSVYVKER